MDARVRSYELAAAMQLSAPEALDLSSEPQHILNVYGIHQPGRTYPTEINSPEEAEYFGRKCLIARRLLERGVRFVQIWSGNDNSFPRRNWDSHENIARDHRPLAEGMAVGTAALIKDLKQTGLLDDTIVLWTTEFGRMPSSQAGTGRDHNPYVFTNWLCGGGIQGGVTYGESDEWGYKPLDRANPTQVYDIHATSCISLASTTGSSLSCTTASTGDSPTCTATSFRTSFSVSKTNLHHEPFPPYLEIPSRAL